MTTTREQRLREFEQRCRILGEANLSDTDTEAASNAAIIGFADELAAILAEPVEVSEDMLDRAHDAYESEARHTANNIALRNALTAALKEPGQ